MTRADKLLARSGLYTRSEARELIRAGRVTIGGRAVSKPEDKFPDGAAVLVDGSEVNCEEFRYFMLSKPAGILSATDDSRARTVLDLFPPELRRLGIAPVGRLDKDTTGLLLLTNDGDFAHRVISPKSGVVKRYLARTAAQTGPEDAAAFAEGLTLADGTRCLPARLEPLEGCRCLVYVREGKYHQVKRMLAALGKPCLELRRESIGGLELDPALGEGEWRELRQFERALVFNSSVYIEG